MEDRFRLRSRTIADAGNEVALVKVVGNATFGKILVLFAALQVIDGNDVGDSTLVEGENVVAADEAGCTCDENTHDNQSLKEFFIGNGGGAKLANNYAGSAVGGANGFFDGHACGEHGGENGNNCVART